MKQTKTIKLMQLRESILLDENTKLRKDLIRVNEKLVIAEKESAFLKQKFYAIKSILDIVNPQYNLDHFLTSNKPIDIFVEKGGKNVR